MTSAAAAELARLAHLLGRPPAAVEFLADLPPVDLRRLRRQVGQALFDADRPAFEKVAGLARVIPVAIAARVTAAALAPVIAARVAELLEPRRAAELVARLPDAYLADVAAVMDPSRAPDVVAALPVDRVGAVARELGRREAWVVIGAFLSYVSPDALRTAVAAYDGGQLLRIGFVVEDEARRGALSALLSDAQIDALLAAAATRRSWTELDEMICSGGEGAAARYAARLAAAPRAVRTAFDRAGAAERLSAVARARLSLA